MTRDTLGDPIQDDPPTGFDAGAGRGAKPRTRTEAVLHRLDSYDKATYRTVAAGLHRYWTSRCGGCRTSPTSPSRGS